MVRLLLPWLLTVVSISASALNVTISARSDGADRPIIWGTTNLPDGTALMVTVLRSQTGFEGDQKTVVLDGKFKAGPYGPASGLSPGAYKLTVMSVVSAAQDPGVRAEFGPQGEKLTGKLIKRADFGGRHAVYTTSIKVDGRTDAKADTRQKSERAVNDKAQFCAEGCVSQGFRSGPPLDRCMRACMRP